MSEQGQISWFVVTTDDQSIRLSVTPPTGRSWRAANPFDSVIRVCLAAEGPLESDGLVTLTDLRPESCAVPVEAVGGGSAL